MGSPRIRATLLNLNRDGHPHKPGSVIVSHNDAYLVETSGAFRKVQVLEETADGVRYRQIKAATKAEKKAMKRVRARARADLAAAALRVAARTLTAMEPIHG